MAIFCVSLGPGLFDAVTPESETDSRRLWQRDVDDSMHQWSALSGSVCVHTQCYCVAVAGQPLATRCGTASSWHGSYYEVSGWPGYDCLVVGLSGQKIGRHNGCWSQAQSRVVYSFQMCLQGSRKQTHSGQAPSCHS